MNQLSNRSKRYGQYLLAIVILVSVAIAYMHPMLDGKVLAQADMLQAKGMRQDLVQAYEQTGEIGRWTSRNFAGMPADLLFGRYPSNVSRYVIGYFGQKIHPQAGQMMLMFLAFFVAMLILGYSPMFSTMGALAFGFSTYHILLLDVGHTSKIQALSMAPMIIAGVIYLFQKDRLVGGIIVAAGFSLQLAGQHLQITYYTLMIVGVILLFEAASQLKLRNWKAFSKGIGVLAIGLVIGVLPNTSLLWSTYDYSKETIRGNVVLESAPQENKTGLSSDYANVFSHGIDETLTLVIPSFKGGSINEQLDKDSETYKAAEKTGLMKNRFNERGMAAPLYWGDQPQSAGPVYFGVIVLQLFICALFFVEKKFRYRILTLIGMTLVVAWGRHTGPINDLLFNLLPGFNKFRAPSMILSLTNILMIWTVMEGLQRVLKDRQLWEKNYQLVMRVSLVMASVCFFFWWAGSSLYTYSWNYGIDQLGFTLDQNLQGVLGSSGAPQDSVATVYGALKNDRQAAMESDALRSFILIALLAGVFWVTRKKGLPLMMALGSIVILLVFDLWFIDKRYLNENDFIEVEKITHGFGFTPADQEIIAQRRGNDRMVDATRAVFQDSKPAYFHATVGGNHGAKLRRYQDLIDRHLNNEIHLLRNRKKGVVPALNMLNTRFIKLGPKKDQYLNNVTSLGFAWFVQNVQWVTTADQEIAAISELNGAERAILHEEFKEYMIGFEESELSYGKIELLEYGTDKVVYKTHADVEQLVVFSEIWYKGNDYWKVYIDDEPSSHIRANYILRAMRVPAGSHEIRFEYYPTPYYIGERISAFGSILLIALLLFLPFKGVLLKK